MVNGFKKRKIQTDETLGQVLKLARTAKEISLEDAEIGSKVRAKYLVAIEAGEWQKLPSVVYVRGFVLAYAKFLALEKERTEKLFDKEYGFISTQKATSLGYKKLFSHRKVLITPKLLAYSFFSIFLLSMFGYIFYQIIGFAGSPTLSISSPSNNTVLESDSIDIKGLADTSDLLTVNNEAVAVATDGHFSTNVKLQRGINVVRVRATNKAKKETTETLTVEYKPSTAMLDDRGAQN